MNCLIKNRKYDKTIINYFVERSMAAKKRAGICGTWLKKEKCAIFKINISRIIRMAMTGNSVPERRCRFFL